MSFISKIKISTRLWLSLGVSLVLLAALAASGLRSLAASNAAIEDMYGAGLQHTARVGQILDKLGESRAHVLLAMQHDPSGQYAALHDHAISQHLDSIRENSALIDSLWAEIQASDLNDSELVTVREFTDVRDTLLKKGMDPALAALERGDYKTVAEILVTVINPTFEKVDGVAETFLGQQSDEAAANLEEANTRYHAGVILSISLLGIAVLIVGGLSWLTARSVGRSVHALDDAATRLGDGDLTVRVAAEGRDELAHIGEAFNRVAERFGEIVRQLQEASSQIAASADQTSVVTKQSTEGMRRQQAETEQVATAMNQMNATVHDVAHSAAEAASAAREADVSTNEGKNVVDQTMATIDRLAKEVEQASEVIRNLEQETASIGTVLDVIRGVAEQTNLLALNAAIEAARAGEQGRGFAVVADEVRTLASRTQKSTEEINDMIARLQSGAAQAVQVMEVGRNQANKGVEEAKLAGQALEVITAAMGRITDMNTQIANAAEEQGAVAEEINRNIANISQVTEETVGGAVQTGAASAQLASLAEQLHGMIARLRVS